jgi:CBS domain containing-hemolysin-like protein
MTMDVLAPILIVVVLILLNALFVAAEFAIVGAPRTAIERRAKQGQRMARTVHQILQDPRQQDRYIATAQLGITVASLGLGMYGEHALADWISAHLEALGASRWIAAHSVASVVAVAILTYFHIVVGEMVPKSIALQSAERTVLWITPLMLAIKTATLPLVIGLNALGNLLLKWAGIDRQAGSKDHLYSPEELALIVEESEEGGLLRAEAGQMLRDLFAFGDLTAREAMAPRVKVAGIPLGATPEDVRAIVLRHPHTRYPVYEGDLDHIAGLVHIKELRRLLGAGQPVRVEGLRTPPYVPETAPLDTVLATLRGQSAQMAIVLDEHGGTAGVITLEDLFDEVAGEIPEGFEPQPLYRDVAGRLHVAGTVRIAEVGEALDLELEHPEVDSVSGLVMTLLGHPPQVGDAVEYDHVRFEVVAIDRHAVRECIVTPLAPPVSGPPD